MITEYQPWITLVSWIALGASVGFVATHTFVGMVKGVRTIWPVAFLFTITGWLAAELPGMLAGLALAAVMGWVVGQVS
jgi:hypothetical protein